MKNVLAADGPKTDHFEVAKGVWGLKTVFVNLYMIAINKNDWVLVDAGLKGSADKILTMANELFGNNPPKAIILTHGHFDHVGNIETLLKNWDVPVFVHPLELPYVTGGSAYPPPDPTSGGGLMSLLSVTYPYKSINLGNRVHQLDSGEHLPFLTDWKYIHTPGHAPGHISLFREKDRLLISGDAFVSTRQESAFAVATQKKVISGPPRYFTYNWPAAKKTVLKLRELAPAIAATGHGKPMYGEELIKGLDELIDNFDADAVPSNGRYVHKPAKANRKGVQYVPEKSINQLLVASILLVSGSVAFIVARKLIKNSLL
ncbi:MBL fold metallo-hydrolase [Mucilaginibacter terrenus]|uniref:MBL fold metallo-hydrolase n=1 Tax=Mucilaginibacter terrenus TaxID=2482727 RepID=A0A3E2NVB1_9SPHI|nr:MBL fold metallo-hydrolase [Mucilaginibacter terrenus]RFZ84954.1 MBL fold metallo-hydrolase [Mucilaginibacter terrenus]